MSNKFMVLVRDFCQLQTLSGLFLAGIIWFGSSASVQATPVDTEAAKARCESWHLPDGYDAGWVPEVFKAPCLKHRQCYSAEDASWAKCNSDFYAGLRQSCETMFPHAALVGGDEIADPSEEASQRPSTAGALLACLQVADDFFAKVQTASGLKQFQQFQAERQQIDQE